MNAVKERISRIRTDLKWVCSEFHRLNKLQKFDLERSAEHFFCGLLNLAMDCDLVIVDRFDTGYPGLDLVDPASGLAVKFAESFAGSTLEQDLDIFYQHHLGNRFSRFILLNPASVRKATLRKYRQTRNIPEFIELWDSDTLISQITSLPAGKLTAIDQYLAGYIAAHAFQPKHPLPPLPLSSDNFITGSRDKELEQLEQLLKSDAPLFIWGLGGIGKTQTAIQLAKKFAPPRGAFFIRCVVPTDPHREVLRETILAADFAGYHFEGADNENRDREYRERLELLHRDYAGAMLIIDNLDCDTKSLEQLQTEQAFEDLSALNLKLVFTTRSRATRENGLEVGALSDADLLQLMHSHICSEDYTDEELLPLIHAVDRHTLMVDLMARLLENSWGEVTPEILLEALKHSTLEYNDFPEVASDHNRRYESRNIYSHLQALFNVSGLTEHARNALRHATLLPADGLDERLFLQCLAASDNASVRSLVNEGWLQRQYHRLTIHPVVREVCRGELDPTDDNCRNFLQRLWEHFNLSTEFREDLFRQVARCFATASDTLADSDGTWAYYTGRYWNTLQEPRAALPYLLRALNRCPDDERYRNTLGITYRDLGDLQKALDYQQQVMDILGQMEHPPLQDLATAYSNVGTTLYAMGDSRKALEYQLKALEIREQVLPEDHLQLANSYNNVGITYADLNDNQKALEHHLKALDIRRKSLRDHPDLAQSYTNVGLACAALGNHKTALLYQKTALTIREKELSPDHLDLARAYSNMGLTCNALGDPGKALEYQLKALEIREKELPQDHPDIATSCTNIGSTYAAMKEYASALEYTLRALEIREKVLAPEHPDLALTYNHLSNTYIAMREYGNALEFAQKALAIRKKVLPQEHPHLAASYQTMGNIFLSMGDYKQALDYTLKAMQIFEKVLPAEHPDLAAAYNNVGSTYARQGDYIQAQVYLERALTILQRTLPAEHPHVNSTWKTLAYIRERTSH